METKLFAAISLAKQIKVYKISNRRTVVRIDALEAKDWPNNISDNGMYIVFHIDEVRKTIEHYNSGYVYLSPVDKLFDQYKYFSMRSIHTLLDKKFRKSSFKTEEDVINKIATYTNKVFDALVAYTGGYPYKSGI